MKPRVDREVHLDLVAIERHPGDRADADAVDPDLVRGDQVGGIAEVCRVGGLVVDQRQLRELQRAVHQRHDQHHGHQTQHTEVALAETLHEQAAVCAD